MRAFLICCMIVLITGCVQNRVGPEAGPRAADAVKQAHVAYWQGVEKAFRKAAESTRSGAKEDAVLSALGNDLDEARKQAKAPMNEWSGKTFAKWQPAKAAKAMDEMARAAAARAK